MTSNEKQLLANLIESMNQQLDQRERISKAQAKRSQNLIRARREKNAAENERDKKRIILVGIAAAILGVIMLNFIFAIWKDMDVMREKMIVMGDQMIVMNKYMQYMEGMAGDINKMRPAMVDMNASIQTMDHNFQSVTNNMGSIETVMVDMQQRMTPGVVSMSYDMAEMNQSVRNMNADTAVMRTGVSRMASDTGVMMQPFRTINRFNPWD